MALLIIGCGSRPHYLALFLRPAPKTAGIPRAGVRSRESSFSIVGIGRVKMAGS